ncbi:MAG: RidA family protein [Bacteroidota bacterium]
MKKEVIFTEKAAKPGGAYSQAIKAGNLIFVSGCTGVDPKTGQLIAPGEMRAQTRQTLENIKAILESCGSSLEQVVKVTAFIDDMNEFKDFNEEYSHYFKKGDYPARSTVEIGKFLNGTRVEIEAIAIASK